MDRWMPAGDVDHRLAYLDVVLADIAHDQLPGDEMPPPLVGRHRRLDVDDSAVLQRLLPAAADRRSPTAATSLRRRSIRASLGSLLGDQDAARDVTDDASAAPWCVATAHAGAPADDPGAPSTTTTRLETVL